MVYDEVLPCSCLTTFKISHRLEKRLLQNCFSMKTSPGHTIIIFNFSPVYEVKCFWMEMHIVQIAVGKYCEQQLLLQKPRVINVHLILVALILLQNFLPNHSRSPCCGCHSLTTLYYKTSLLINTHTQEGPLASQLPAHCNS